MIRSNITVARIPPVMTTVPAVIRKALHQHPPETKGKPAGHMSSTGDSTEIDSLIIYFLSTPVSQLATNNFEDAKKIIIIKLSNTDVQTVSEVESPTGIFPQLLRNLPLHFSPMRSLYSKTSPRTTQRFFVHTQSPG